MAVLDENNFAAIKKDEWRASLAPTQDKASICLANLHDLLIEGYDSDGYPILWCKKFNEDMVANDGIVRGTKLDRDTFLFQKSLYSGGKLSITSKVEDFNTYAIDATPPIYDLRAKSEKIDVKNPISIPNSSLSTNVDLLNRSLSVLSNKITLKIAKKDSAIQPRDTKDFADMKAYSSVSEKVDTDSYEATFNKEAGTSNDRPIFSFFRPERVPLNLGRLVDDGHVYPTVAAEDSLLSICKSSSIILSNKDTVFEKSLVFGSDFSVYTRICFNLFDSDNWTQRIITQSLINSIVGHDRISASSLRENLFADSNGRTLFEEFLNSKYSSEAEDNTLSFPAGLQYWLKNTYVWIRLAAAGDYVDPKDFNQSLNQDASVAFKNLLVRNESADFNRYDKISSEDSADTEDADSSATSMPYIPKTAPLKDFVSEKYVQEKDTVSETMNALIEDSSKIDSKIGSLWSESRASKSNDIGFDQKKSSDDDGDATPLMFFEPDSARKASDYNRVPVIIPKYGNVMAESRFMGPSADEIWYMIKKIISGQNKDTVYDQDFSRSRGTQDKRKSLVDTRIKEVDNPFSFKFGNTAIEGDPLDFDIEYNSAKGKISKVSVKEYVVQPEESVFAYNTDDLAAVEAIETGATGSKTGYTKLTSITLKGTNAYTEDSKPISKASQKTGEDMSEYKKWLPREYPLSLRELEARILGNRFSIATNFQYITKNFTVVGGLGKVHTDNDRVDSAGSLYQLHKDYNFKPDSPNTVFETGASASDNSSKDVKHYDYDSLSDAGKSEENNFKGLDGDVKTVNGLVRYAKNYGVDKSVTTSQNNYTAAQVYMGADGEWHLMNEVVRVPILRSRFI